MGVRLDLVLKILTFLMYYIDVTSYSFFLSNILILVYKINFIKLKEKKQIIDRDINLNVKLHKHPWQVFE